MSGGVAQQARVMEAVSRHAAETHALIERRSQQFGFARSLMQQLVSAADGPAEAREDMMAFVAAIARRELADGGRFAS